MIMDGRAAPAEGGSRLAVVVTVAKGYDLGYIWKSQNQAQTQTQHATGYYIDAAEAGEPPGRWWGPGAQALGLTPGQVVERRAYDAVYQQLDPRTGVRLGRPRGRYPTFAEHLARLTAAEPHASAERRIELERQAAQATRQPAAYTDVTISFSKSISVLHASIRENQRRAQLAGDRQATMYWAGREQAFPLPRHDHQPSREVVHAQVEGAVLRTTALGQAEDAGAQLAPGGDVGRLDAQVAERPDHRFPPSRKLIASRLNSSNFSS